MPTAIRGMRGAADATIFEATRQTEKLQTINTK
jgi:hypothetical protein